MNLLIVTNNLARASFRQRIAIHLDTLRANGIECEIEKLPSGSLARRRLFKQAKEFDGVLLHKKRLNFLEVIWLRRYNRAVIYDFDDAVMYSAKNPDRPSYKRYKSFEETIKLAKMVIAGNTYLAEHAKKFNSNVNILPTGLNINAYKLEKNQEKDDKIHLVWIGCHSTLKYLAEIKPALEKIGSRFNNVVLKIICDKFLDLQNMKVEKCPWIQEKQAIDLATNGIGISPLSNNRYTKGKCGFKILQYASVGLPVVASPVGVNLEYICDNTSGYFAKNNDEWVERITQLIKNPQLRTRMGLAGQQLVEKFDAAILGEQLYKIIY
ncbi:MAG: glycosyltransferase family 4 protein, partial [Planctomycetota bacterium]